MKPRRNAFVTATCLLTVVSTLAMAASAPVSSAAWMVNGGQLTGSKAIAPATVTESLKLTAAGVTITCTGGTVEAVGAEIIAPTGSVATSVTFTGCSANGSCTVAQSISTGPITVEPTLEGTKAVKELIKPKTKTVFATFRFEGTECALLGTQPVTGRSSASAPSGQVESTLQQFNANVTEASAELKVGSSAAGFKGGSLIKLTTGEAWSFL